MKRFSVILPLFAGTLAYSILSFCAGPRGIVPMQRLETEKNRVSRNLDDLYGIREDLDARYRNLTSDPDTISVYAHELGYVASGERLIKLAGFSGGIDRALISGTAVAAVRPTALPEWLCKLVGLLSGALAFFLYSHFSRSIRHDNTQKRS
jgi:hypothetical protein